MTTHYKIAIIGALTATIGVIGLAPVAMSAVREQSPQQPTSTLEQANPITPSPETPVISGNPVRIEVPAAGINLTIIEGHFNENTGEWTLTDNKAQFAVPTAAPNNKNGNTLIYGHNTPQIFAALHKQPAGTIAKVYTDNGHVFSYTLRGSETVSPTNTAIFDYQGAPQLTLQTCTGVWSEARRFFYFDLTSTE